MKAPRFGYYDPTTLDEALGLLAEFGDSAKVLAGGQSLMPLLNFRLARPAQLIDVNRIAELGAIGHREDGAVELGATVRQRELERSRLIGEHCSLVSQAMPLVGHPQIRNRGTLGGSLAHADPAAELPAVMLALEAQLTLQKQAGSRVVAASDFFVGQLTTVLEPDELLTRIDIPRAPSRTGACIKEVAMRIGDFALGGVAATLTLHGSGRIDRARIVCFGVDERPVRQLDAELSLQGNSPGDEVFAEAGRIVSENVRPFDDIHASARYRKRLVGVLTSRALCSALGTIQQAETVTA